MEVNLSLSAEENLIAQINHDNQSTGLSLNLNKVSFGVPQARSPGSDPNNTAVEVLPGPLSKYTGSTTVTYTRLPMDHAIPTDDDGRVHVTQEYTIEQMTVVIANYLSLVASELLYQYGEPPNSPGTGDWFNFIVKDDSLLYLPGGMDLRVVWDE